MSNVAKFVICSSLACACAAQPSTSDDGSSTGALTGGTDASGVDSSSEGSSDGLPAECADHVGSEACADALEASCVALTSKADCDARPDVAQSATGLGGNFRCVWEETVVARMDGASCVVAARSDQCYGAVFVGEGGPTCLNDGCTVQPPTPFYAAEGDATRLVLTECGWIPIAFAPCDSEGAPPECDCFCA